MKTIHCTCICGEVFEVEIVGEGIFYCPACEKAYERVFDVILDDYDVIEA